MNAGQVAGLIWDACVWLFLLSFVAAPFVALVQRCRARGRRLFRDLPNERLRGLHQDTTHTHEMDAL